MPCWGATVATAPPTITGTSRTRGAVLTGAMTFGDFPLSWARIVQQPVTGCVAGGAWARRDHMRGFPYTPIYCRTWLLYEREKAGFRDRNRPLTWVELRGGAKGIRTPDLLHAMQPGFV